MIQRCLNFPDKFITFRIRIRLDFLFHKRKLCPIEGSRVIIITNDILTIFPYHYLCRALPGKDKYTSGNWMNLGRTPTLREVNQIDLEGTAHQNKLTVTDRYAWSIQS